MAEKLIDCYATVFIDRVMCFVTPSLRLPVLSVLPVQTFKWITKTFSQAL